MSAVGVIGLGAMGGPIAGHLLRHGHRVVGYDIKPGPMQALTKLGGRSAGSAREVGAQSELTLIVLVDDAQVIEACTGADGVLAGASKDAVIAILSSVSPHTCREIGARARPKAVHVLDAPMVRGELAAIAGTLLLMIGGDAGIVARCRPIFAAFAGDLCHLGELGAGEIGKMVNNMLLWVAVAANHEGIGFAKTLGADPAALRDSLRISSGDNWALREWERITAQPKWWDQKDLEGALQLAEKAGIPLPLMTLVKKLMEPLRPEKAQRLFAGTTVTGSLEK